MTDEKFRQLRKLLMEQLEQYREISDEEIYEMIDQLLLCGERDLYVPLARRVEMRTELFNSVRRLDILQELVDDDTVTEIMVNGTDGIFIEQAGQLRRWEKSYLQGKVGGYCAADCGKVQQSGQ